MGVHRHPRAILEVRRILLEHLAEVRMTQRKQAEEAFSRTHK
jgi:hypothetical protein